MLFISYRNKAEKKRKGKTVTTPWTEDPRLFADQGAAPGDCIVCFFKNLYYLQYIFCTLNESAMFSGETIFLRKQIQEAAK